MELRFEPGFTSHPKLVAVGPLGLALYVTAIDHAVLNLTDGHVSSDQLSGLVDFAGVTVHSDRVLPGMTESVNPALLVQRLTAVRLLDETDDGYVIHDFEQFQATRSSLWTAFSRAERKRERDRLRMSRDRATTDSRGSGLVERDRAVQDSAALPLSEDRDTEPLVLLAEQVAGVDDRTIPAWLSASRGLPLEWASARALESLKRRRQVGPLRNEAGYVTKTLHQLRQERAA